MSKQGTAWIVVSVALIVVLALGGTLFAINFTGSHSSPATSASPSASSTAVQAKQAVDVSAEQLVTLVANGAITKSGVKRQAECSTKSVITHLEVGGSVDCAYTADDGANAGVKITLADYATLTTTWTWKSVTPTPSSTTSNIANPNGGTQPPTNFYVSDWDSDVSFIGASVVVPSGVTKTVTCAGTSATATPQYVVESSSAACDFATSDRLSAKAFINVHADGTKSVEFTGWQRKF